MAVATAGGVHQPSVARGAHFLAGMARSSGAIFDDRNPARALPNYNTALSMTALQVAGDPAHREIIRKAQAYLSGSQFDEAKASPAPRRRMAASATAPCRTGRTSPTCSTPWRR